MDAGRVALAASGAQESALAVEQHHPEVPGIEDSQRPVGHPDGAGDTVP